MFVLSCSHVNRKYFERIVYDFRTVTTCYKKIPSHSHHMIFKRVTNLVAECVKAVRPKDKNAIASVDWRLTTMLCLAMVLMTDLFSPLQRRTTFMLLLNIVVRLTYPSQYCPATASKPGIIAHPFMARCIAFTAEFCMYEVWAVWIGVEFWGDDTKLWLVVRNESLTHYSCHKNECDVLKHRYLLESFCQLREYLSKIKQFCSLKTVRGWSMPFTCAI